MNPAIIARLQSASARMNQLEAMMESLNAQSDRTERSLYEAKQKWEDYQKGIYQLVANALVEEEEEE